MARQPDPPRLGPLGALPAGALASAGDLQDLHREFDERLLVACVAHDPQAAAQALFEHLELASLFFQTELGGQGIFDPR